MEKIKAVIFDLDGTLANTIPLCIESFRRVLEPLLGRSLSDEEITSAFGPDEEGTLRRFVPGGYREATARFISVYESLHDMCSRPFEGIIQLLTDLKRKEIRLALSTGKGSQTTAYTLQRLGLFSFFEKIETGSLEGSRKPEAITGIIRFFGDIEKENIIYVGDSAGDIRDSRKAGISVVSAAWADNADIKELCAACPDALFTSVSGFHDWITSRVFNG